MKTDNLTLDQIDKAFFDHGTISREDMESYVDLWNNTAGRFTVAKIGANYIYTQERRE